MTRIHLNRDRQNLGQFSPEEVAAGLRDGRFLPTDLAWREGMETWQPLSTFTDLPPAPAPDVEPAPTLAPGSPVEVVAATAPISPAWEREDSSGWFTRLIETIKEVLISPQTAFAGMPVTGGFRKPLIFLLIVGSVGSIVSTFYQLVIELLSARTPESPESLLIGAAAGTAVYIVLIVLMPLIIAVASFISAGIFHLALMLTGATPKSYEATYRVVAYANGATSVLLLIPFCGSLVQVVWNLVLLIIGFKEVHGTTMTRAVVAVLLPVALCCGLMMAVIAAAIAIPAASQLPR